MGLWNRSVRNISEKFQIFLSCLYFLLFKKKKISCTVTIFYDHSFLDDIEVMLKWRPPVVYKYLWKYVCLLSMVTLLAASLLRMIFKRPTYTAWNQSTVKCLIASFNLYNTFLLLSTQNAFYYKPQSPNHTQMSNSHIMWNSGSSILAKDTLTSNWRRHQPYD